MFDDVETIETVRDRLTQLRDARKGDEELYISLCHCIGALYCVQQAIKGDNDGN